MERAAKKRGVWLAALLLASAEAAQAIPLQLPGPVPGAADIFASGIWVSYDAGKDYLYAGGTAVQVALEGQPHWIDDISGNHGAGVFELTAFIDATGAFSKGNLTVTGYVDGVASPTGTLLAGELAAFGFPDPSDVSDDPLEFVFTPTSGDLASYYPLGVEVILHNAGFDRKKGFGAGFSNYDDGGMGTADAYAAVPEPVTALAIALSCSAVGFYLRSRATGKRCAQASLCASEGSPAAASPSSEEAQGILTSGWRNRRLAARLPAASGSGRAGGSVRG